MKNNLNDINKIKNIQKINLTINYKFNKTINLKIKT